MFIPPSKNILVFFLLSTTLCQYEKNSFVLTHHFLTHQAAKMYLYWLWLSHSKHFHSFFHPSIKTGMNIVVYWLVSVNKIFEKIWLLGWIPVHLYSPPYDSQSHFNLNEKGLLWHKLSVLPSVQCLPATYTLHIFKESPRTLHSSGLPNLG